MTLSAHKGLRAVRGEAYPYSCAYRDGTQMSTVDPQQPVTSLNPVLYTSHAIPMFGRQHTDPAVVVQSITIWTAGVDIERLTVQTADHSIHADR